MSDLATIQADVRALVLATGLPVITFSEAELGVGRVDPTQGLAQMALPGMEVAS